MLEDIVQEIFRNRILPASYQTWSELSGGTNSQIGIISSSDSETKYVVKVNTPEQIHSESQFYEFYRIIQLLPKVVYVHPEHKYMLYHYVAGKTEYPRGTKATLMRELVQKVIRCYVPPTPLMNLRRAEDPQIVKEDLAYAKSVIGTHVSSDNHRLVAEIQERRRVRIEGEPSYVLHGDFGVHNFLFESGKLSGVIDAIPCIGRPLYDVLYAFCSSPDDLYLSTLVPIVEQMGDERMNVRDLIDDMIVALYQRICTCLIHHPQDLPEYLQAWKEWVGLMGNS